MDSRMATLTPEQSPLSQTNLQQNFYDNQPGNAPPVPNPSFSPQHHSDDGGVGDSKRRRIARACDMCRKKKIKCDGKTPSCTHCINYKTECVFTFVEKKRNPPKGAKYIEGLENRLGRMESLLRLSGLLPEGDDSTDLGDLERRLLESGGSSMRAGSQPGRSSSESARATPSSSAFHSSSNSPKNVKDEESVDALSEQMCSLVTDNCGETRFIGSSSGFSIFSLRGIQWVNEKTGDDSFQRMISNAMIDGGCHSKRGCWAGAMFTDIFGQNGSRSSRPPKAIAQVLVQDFFGGFNELFPLFHRNTFEAMFEKEYSDDPPHNSGWYAAFNIVLAIACRLRISHTPEKDNELINVAVDTHIKEAWKYFQNATSVLIELLLRNTDLLSIQSILGMALFMQGTSNPQPSFFLIAAAVRIATSIGMHRRGNNFGLSPLELEQRRRIFWILYLMDKDIALRSGRPPCINDEDCSVELPEEDPLDGVGDVPLPSGKGKFNLFRAMARFAVIESKVYMQLYSAKAAKQSDGELLNTIGRLDKELEEWRESVPAELRPENENHIQGQQGSIVMHVVVLHFAYYNCLTTIHRMSIHHGYWSSRLSDYAIAGLSVQPLNPRVFSSASLCVAAARATIHLIEYLDPKDYPCTWLVMYYPVSALVTLFANVLQNPQDPRARNDLDLMHLVVVFIQSVLEIDHQHEPPMNPDDGSIERMKIVCNEFHRIAQVALDKAEKDNHGRKKRKLPGTHTARPAPSKATALFPAASGDPPQQNFTPGDPDTLPTPGIPGLHPQAQVSPLPLPPLVGPANISDSKQHIFDTPDFPPNNLSWLNEVPASPNNSLHGMPGDAAGSFEQPFVPQDLWQMPMTFEWDWADVGNMWDGCPPPGNM